MSKRGGFHYDDAHVVASCPWRPPCHFPPIDEADDDDDGDYLQQTEVAAGQMAKWGLILGRKLPHSAFWFRPFRDDVNNAISIPVPAAIEVKEQQQQPKSGSPVLPHPYKPPCPVFHGPCAHVTDFCLLSDCQPKNPPPITEKRWLKLVFSPVSWLLVGYSGQR